MVEKILVNKRFKSLEDIKQYWKDATDAAHVDTMLFMVDRIDKLEKTCNYLQKQIDIIEGIGE
jgi:hypothetical protein